MSAEEARQNVKEVGHTPKITWAAKQFAAEAEGLLELFRTITPLVAERDKQLSEELRAFGEELVAKELKVPYSRVIALGVTATKLALGQFIFMGHALVALVSRFDAFIGNVTSSLLKAFPYKISKRTLTYAEAAQFKSIDELTNKFVEEEVDNLLREPHRKQLQYIGGLLGINLGDDEPKLIADFVEVTERRNVHVHASGMVTPQYLRVCAENKVALSAGLKLGDKLVCCPINT